MEDSILFSWDNSQVNWWVDSSSVVRKHYTKNINQSSWSLRSTDYSVRDVNVNGFIYDEILIRDGNAESALKTLNKGTITFTVKPISPVGTNHNYFLYTNYEHKVYSITGFQSGVSFSSLLLTGSFDLSFGFGIGTKYDAMGASFACAFN
jgi:hypothetical protein